MALAYHNLAIEESFA